MISMSRVTAVYRHDYIVAPVQPPPPRRAYERIDWEGMRRDAALGILPAEPELSGRRQHLLGIISEAAMQGDRQTLINLDIGTYNSVTKALTKYRDICVAALEARDQ